jgi:hypothetical protein
LENVSAEIIHILKARLQSIAKSNGYLPYVYPSIDLPISTKNLAPIG